MPTDELEDFNTKLKISNGIIIATKKEITALTKRLIAYQK
jgi:hypothetical protein